MYAREIDERVLTFGVSGKLILNAMVMYDRQTDSLWSQFLGEAVDGPLAGTTLELVSSQVTTWSAWREEYPDTQVLDSLGPVSDHYARYYADGTSGVLGQSHFDGRLPSKGLVVGISGQIVQRAYPHSRLADIPVLNDEFEGLNILVTFDAETRSTSVFYGHLDGMDLTFSQASSSGEMTDAETGSVWSKLTGVATGGPLKGKRLTRYPSFDVFWFAWTDFYPDTELFVP